MSALSLVASTTIVNVTVNGASTGSIGGTTITGGTFPYVITWTSSTGATSIPDTTANSKSGLTAGTYRISVTDSASTPATLFHDYVITQPAALVLTAGRITHATQEGANTGAIAATTISGGTSPYTAAWTTTGDGGTTIVDTSADAHVSLAPATYRITVTDSAGAVAFLDYVLTVQTYTGLTLVPGAVTDDLNEGKWWTDIAASTVTGGDGNYLVTWESPAHGTPITAATLGPKTHLEATGKYTLTVIDGSGLGAVHTFNMSHHPKLFHHVGGGYSEHSPLDC
jgi:hypothetical protein